LFPALIRPGDIVIDVGGNVGYFTILASEFVGAHGKVYSVEPSSNTRIRLDENIKLNRVSNVEVLAYAAWNGVGKANFYQHSSDRGGCSLRDLGSGIVAEEASLVRLDAVIPAGECSRVRLIKLDIEGAECQALEGLSSLLESNGPLSIVVEVEDKKLRGLDRSAEDLFELLLGYGMTAYRIANDYGATAYMSIDTKPSLTPIVKPIGEDAYVLFARGEDVIARIEPFVD